jgi:amino acid transporter
MVQTKQPSQQARSLRSETYISQTMPRILGSFDMTATFVVATYALSSAPTAVSGGPAAYIYWLIGAVFFLVPCAIVTAQLGVMLPHEGSLYNWTYHALGRFWSFFVGLCSWLPGPLVVVGIGDEFAQLIQGLNPKWLTEPWQQGCVILAMVAVSMFLSLQRFRLVQNLVNAAFVCGLLGSLILTLAGITWIASGHHSATNFALMTDLHTITPNTYSLYGLIMFAYIGANLVLNMGGEIKMPQSSIPRHLLWGSLILFCCYLAITTAILAVQGVQASFVTYAIIGTVDLVFGKLVGDLTAVLFLMASILAATVYNYAYARLLLVGAIDNLLPAGAGKLNRRRVPGAAVIFQAWFSAAFTVLVFIVVPYLSGSVKPADINTEVYYVSQAAATLIWVISLLFLFINLLFLKRKEPTLFQQVRLFSPLVLWGSVVLGIIAIVVAIVNTLLYSWTVQIANQQWWFIAGGLTLTCLAIAGITSLLATGQADWETMTEEVRTSS